MLSPDLQRLVRIDDYCAEIKATIDRYGASYEVFLADRDYQRSVSFCILQIGELAGALSDEYRQATKSSIPWHQIKGMRNLVAHTYNMMSMQTVWETATADIPALKAFCDTQLEGMTFPSEAATE